MVRATPLTELARAGFNDLSAADGQLTELAKATGLPRGTWLTDLSNAADPDRALSTILALVNGAADDWEASGIAGSETLRIRLARLFGASHGIAQFFVRQPSEIRKFPKVKSVLRSQADYSQSLCAAVGASAGYARHGDEAGWIALRTTYRRHLVEIMLADLESPSAAAAFAGVAAALSDLAGATLEAALTVARTNVAEGLGVGKRFDRAVIDRTRLAIIAMGKCGARELNYVSDVDVIFVGESADSDVVSSDEAIACGTRLATETMRAINDAALEPPLWQVDPNLRPEGKNGPLLRTLNSHLAYYERWAKSWEFQALLKARFVAGDAELGSEYIDATRPLVWSSASRENFVESAQRMRERVTENIPAEHIEYQIKLGPGGLRDVEFTVQLLQLVHGQKSESLRATSTLDAITQLTDGGFIARTDGQALAHAYADLRVLEHRMQMRELVRTALFPSVEEDQRWLARASGLGATAAELVANWEQTKERVRALHLKIFYAPLLTAVAAMPGDEFLLTGDEAADRLAAIGFKDPSGALRHIAALTKGVSRRATIQRNLLPVILQWLSDGADPDYGLLAFRRISDSLGDTPWYLRLLRDGAGAALRLTQLLASSRFVGELMEGIPEAVAWLEGDKQLLPASRGEVQEEMDALLKRHGDIDAAIVHILAVRRREVLRLALGSLLGVLTVQQIAQGLTDLAEALLSVVLRGVRGADDGIEFAVVELGRLGGAELSFSSDLDIMFVYRPATLDSEQAAKRASFIVSELQRLLVDPKLQIDLDLDLRPEGKAGLKVRTLDSYRSYYQRWSLTWEAQALLRARCDIGDEPLCNDFTALADEIRYPQTFTEEQLREVRRLKARVENERLPQGADPTRHLKLGKGSVSDVEWLVQLLQLEHAYEHPELRVQGTLAALDACVSLGYLDSASAELLRDAWLLSSELRSAYMLWTNRASDVLPRDRNELEGVARLMHLPAGSTTVLEERYLGTTRRSRGVFEKYFFGYAENDETQGFVAP